MNKIFVATLGQRPEVITVGLARLMEHEQYEEAIILHTTVDHPKSGVRSAYDALNDAMAQHFPALPLTWHEIVNGKGGPLLDIHDSAAASAYLQGVHEVLFHLRQEHWTVHLMVAGGRKSMSIYATIAAAMVFGSEDRVWTVHSPQEMMYPPGQFTIPTGMRDRVQVIGLPLEPARRTITEGEVPDVETMLQLRQDVSADFLSRLPKKERELAEKLKHYNDASNAELAEMLGKTESTIEKQLTSLYDKMMMFVRNPESVRHKRQTLLAILNNQL